MGQAGTVLIAVRDGILADSLRFSLELEGFETRFCDEHTLSPLLDAPCVRGACLVLDQEVFSQVQTPRKTGAADQDGLPVILMVSQKTKRVLEEARIGGVTEVLERPVLGGLMLDTIRQVMDRKETSSEPRRHS